MAVTQPARAAAVHARTEVTAPAVLGQQAAVVARRGRRRAGPRAGRLRGPVRGRGHGERASGATGDGAGVHGDGEGARGSATTVGRARRRALVTVANELGEGRPEHRGKRRARGSQ